MNLRIIGAGLVILFLLALTKCSNTDNKTYTFVKPSQTDTIHSLARKNKFTPWLPYKEYKSKFINKSAYFKSHKTYPAFVQIDESGNRRLIELPYESSFHWRCSSALKKSDFIKFHIKETLNRGKKLLSLSILKKDGIDVYSAVWVSKDVFEGESEKLEELGISVPEFVE